MNGLIFPYPTPEEDPQLTLKVSGAQLDQERERRLLVSHSNSDLVTVSARATIPEEDLESQGHQFSVILCADCLPTNLKRSTTLSRDKKAQAWTGTLTLRRSELRDRVNLRAVVVGASGKVADRLLGASDPWTLLLDDAADASIRGSLEVRWLDFRDNEETKRYDDQPFYVDFSSATPVLWLNSRINDFAVVLPTCGTPDPPLRALYEAYRTSIAQSTWQTMFSVAMAALNDPDEDEDPEWPVTEWQAGILRRVLASVYPDASDEERLRQVLEARKNDDTARLLMSRLVLATEKLAQEGRGTRRALEDIVRAAAEVEAE